MTIKGDKEFVYDGIRTWDLLGTIYKGKGSNLSNVKKIDDFSHCAL